MQTISQETSTLFICVDGINGCGKSTFCRAMQTHIPDLRYMKVPNYETETGKIISLYLQGDDTHKDNIDWYFNENRLEVEKEVKALLDQGIPVIMDRSYLSQQVYFYMRNGTFDWDHEHLQPTHFFLIFPDTDVCAQILNKRSIRTRYYGRKALSRANGLFREALGTQKMGYGKLYTVNRIISAEVLKMFCQKMATEILEQLVDPVQ